MTRQPSAPVASALSQKSSSASTKASCSGRAADASNRALSETTNARPVSKPRALSAASSAVRAARRAAWPRSARTAATRAPTSGSAAWCDRHVEAWARIVDAIHANGAVAILQAWHCGRISHPDNLPLGFEPLGPSTVRPNSYNVSDKIGGQVQMPLPRAMSESAIHQAISEFGQCARYARDAGFDGFEIHGANGYLVEQFASSNTNLRTDQWGGTVSNRLRFMVRVIEAVAEVYGLSRVGIRFSPFGTFNDIHDADPLGIYRAKLEAAAATSIGYIHVIRPTVTGNVDQDNPAPDVDVVGMARAAHKGLLISAGNYDRTGAERELARGAADLIAFGRPFVANPDLVRRLGENLPLSPLREDRLYAGGEEGYADYPAYLES
jgi:N-ethylmaleimide reductase